MTGHRSEIIDNNVVIRDSETEMIEGKKQKLDRRNKQFSTGFFESKSSRTTTLILSVIVGIMFMWMFFENGLNINYTIFAVVLLAVIGYCFHLDKSLDIKQFVFWSIIYLSYASIFFRSRSSAFLVYGFLCTPVALMFLTMYGSKKQIAQMAKTFFLRMFGSIAFIDKIFINISTIGNNKSDKKQHVKEIIFGVLISAVLLSIIIPLMTKADYFFSEKFEVFIELFEFENLNEIFWRIVLSFVMSILAFAFIYIIMAKKYEEEYVDRKANDRNPTTILTILFIIGMVYTLFAIVNFNYLFVAKNALLKSGSSYSDYARSGFFEMAWLSIINYIIIVSCMLISNRFIEKSRKITSYILGYFNLLSYYLIASAWYKMYLYQSKFGFTSLRTFVYIILIFEAIMLVLLMIRIFKIDFKYLQYSIYFCAAFWAAISFLNIEAICINQNIKNMQTTGDIDVYYAISASDDASKPLKMLYMNNSELLTQEEKNTVLDFYFPGHTHRGLPSEEKYSGRFDFDMLDYNISNQRAYNDGIELLRFIEENEKALR